MKVVGTTFDARFDCPEPSASRKAKDDRNMQLTTRKHFGTLRFGLCLTVGLFVPVPTGCVSTSKCDHSA
jgi:hypothetical protein